MKHNWSYFLLIQKQRGCHSLIISDSQLVEINEYINEVLPRVHSLNLPHLEL